MNLLPVGHSFTSFASINSTNIYAMERIREGMAVHGEVFFAHEQTEGRGQRGKKWWALPGENIQMTAVLQPLKLATSQPFRLSATVALAVHDWLSQTPVTGWKIKWPNDLYWGDRKAGGILIENVIQSGTWVWAVVGIGININSKTFHPDIPNATSLSLLAPEHAFDPEQLARQLCPFLEARWQMLMAGGWPTLFEQYNAVLYKSGEPQRLKRHNSTAVYKIVQVAENGQLVAGQHGEYLFDHGDVEWVVDN
jgi:BirA family transcriptional regulator, biotin operon repressor / biotin---[acetyl-CoA-carboxylase] ligase